MTKTNPTESGYTLLEVMIAIVIIGIGFLALIAVQLGALRGYISARDSLQSAEAGRRVAEIVQAQGEQWVQGEWAGSAAYGGVGPFDAADPIGQAVLSGTWVSLFEQPSDLAANRPAIHPEHLGGKFCAFLRGGEMPGAITDSVLQFQIAIVYAGPNATLNECAQINTADLDIVGSTTTPPALEALGLRASYYGTVVVRRSHLQDVI